MRNYTQEEYEYAKYVNLIEYLSNRGYDLVKVGREYTLKDHDSMRISENKWYWNSQNKGGSPIQFLVEYEKMDFKSAVLELSNGANISKVKSDYVKSEKVDLKKEKIDLPEASENMNRTIAYLTKSRQIDYDIVKEMIDKKLIFEDVNHNTVFVGKDNNNEVKYATKRGTSTYKKFQGEVKNSDKKYGFKFNENESSKRVYVFESPIDLLSHMTLTKQMTNFDYKNQNRIALGGVSDASLSQYLEEHKNVSEIILCLDNDEAGWTASEKMYAKYKDNYKVDICLPKQGKDYNEYLISIINEKSIGKIGEKINSTKEKYKANISILNNKQKDLSLAR